MEGNPEMLNFENHHVGDCHGDADTNKKEIYNTMCEREKKKHRHREKPTGTTPLSISWKWIQLLMMSLPPKTKLSLALALVVDKETLKVKRFRRQKHLRPSQRNLSLSVRGTLLVCLSLASCLWTGTQYEDSSSAADLPPKTATPSPPFSKSPGKKKKSTQISR